MRQHRRIEHRSYWVRDVTLGDDASRVRTVPIMQVPAALRTAVLGLLHAYGHTRSKAATLDFQAHRWDALALLGITRDNSGTLGQTRWANSGIVTDAREVPPRLAGTEDAALLGYRGGQVRLQGVDGHLRHRAN